MVALASALTWIALEVRRFAHGPHLAGAVDTIGLGEAMGASFALIATALVAEQVGARADGERHPFRQDVGRVAVLIRWFALSATVIATGMIWNPCWGVAPDPAGEATVAAVLVGYAGLAAMIGLLTRGCARRGDANEAEAIADAAIGMALVFAALVVRAAFHGGQLAASLGASEVEGWSYSALGAVFGLALVGVSRRGGRLFLRAGLALLMLTTVKVFVFDTASLSGVVRAGSFLALGVLLVAGALIARRLASPAQGPSPSTALE